MNHLGWGLQISALGMGLVFALLALLWALLTLVLKFDRPGAAAASAAPETPAEAHATGDAAATAASAPGRSLDPALVAAITLAVLTHRRQRRAEAAPQLRLHWPGSLLHASRWVAAGRARQNHTWQRGR